MQRSHDYLGRTEAANRALISVDPAGVGDGNPQVASECDAEAREIARRWVRESAAGEARAAIVGDVVGEHMGVLVDANVAHEVARQIVEDVARAPRRREVELATGKAFLRPRYYYARVATVLVSDRGHRRIAHCGGFGERCMVDVGGAHSADEIHELLIQGGAPATCHVVVSESSEIDDREVPLAETLAYVHGYAPSTLVCVPGRLAYDEAEEPGRRFILQR